MHDPRANVFPRGGGIGQGLGMGIGAALARPDEPTVVIAGDGGLAVHLGELLTLAQERPRLTLIVFNDGGYGVLRNMQDQLQRTPLRRGPVHARLRRPRCRLRPAVRPHRATRADAAPVLEAAIASDGPTLVEVDLDRARPDEEAVHPARQDPHLVGRPPS